MDNAQFKKVLMIGNSLSLKGGMTTVICQILGHDWEKEGISMKFIPTYIKSNIFKKSAYFLAAYVKIFVELAFRKPDMVHLHMSYRGSFYRNNALRLMCKKFKTPVIVHLHGSEFEKWYNGSGSHLKKKIKGMLSESSAFIVLGSKWDEVVKQIEPKTNTVIIKNTVPGQNKCCRWNEGGFRILFLGVLIKRKGVIDLINAIKKLADQDAKQKLHLTIAGSGEEEITLRKKVDELGLADKISFCGWVDGSRRLRLLEESQLMVLPSYNEGLPMSVLEALSFGLPVVATDVGDMSLAVRDNVNGFLLAPGDVNGMAIAINSLMQDRDKWEKYSAGSIKLANAEFSEKDFFERLKSVYLSEYDVSPAV